MWEIVLFPQSKGLSCESIECGRLSYFLSQRECIVWEIVLFPQSKTLYSVRDCLISPVKGTV